METDGAGFIDTPGTLTINDQLCSGCGRCVAACPLHLITLEVSGFRKNAVIESPEKCTLCRQCAEACPVAAIVLT